MFKHTSIRKVKTTRPLPHCIHMADRPVLRQSAFLLLNKANKLTHRIPRHNHAQLTPNANNTWLIQRNTC